MGSKSKKYVADLDNDPYDDFSDLYDDDVDLKELSKDFFSTEREDEYYRDDRISARRKIERRRERQALYSQLDDWADYGRNLDF